MSYTSKLSVSQSALEAAETLGLRAITFVMSEPARLDRFMRESGLTGDDLRERLQSRELMQAALDAVMSNEPELLEFAANQNLDPREVGRALYILAQSKDGAGGTSQPDC